MDTLKSVLYLVVKHSHLRCNDDEIMIDENKTSRTRSRYTHFYVKHDRTIYPGYFYPVKAASSRLANTLAPQGFSRRGGEGDDYLIFE
ncbi:hypothetical protein JR316_0008767 [Psilocybe cubensis]|uniref:Uncharacterized protein n=2 Tax=Psilocybe cubensis TaxID=181762 RepID=A0ACB8GRU3_PSICU|nr:hypothetical protein JR316_0008767 [Psilocybe cubensis]KAH9478314.1 hypothetical protein JR316_0008767 [Psilocybe cubensis]